LNTENDSPNKALTDISQLIKLKEKLGTRETEIAVLQRKIIELYEELQHNITASN